MTPFLYQTKTLSGWGANAILRSCRLVPVIQHQCICKKQYASSRVEGSSRSRRVEEKPQRYREGEGSQWGREYKPRTRKRGAGQNEIPFELNRIPSTKHQEWGKLASIDWDNGKTNEFGEPDGEPRDLEGYEKEDDDVYSDESYGGTSMNLREPQRETTITEAERRAFQKIFSDMFGQSHQPVTTQPAISSSDAGRQAARTKALNIFGNAANKTPKSPEEVEQLMNAYPPALRPAIAKAMGHGGRRGEEEDPFEGELLEVAELAPDELEAIRKSERQRVETLIEEAKTDTALWDVLEKEVFSLIPKLGLDKDPKDKKAEAKAEAEGEKNPKVASATKSKGRKRNKEEAKPELFEPFDKFVAQTPNGTQVSALTFYTPLYPDYLLRGLRLLDRSFARSSPLALAMLPKIKSLGTISHVLGASTAFYNELINIYFYRYEDFANIAKTLKEMEDSAVDFDETTLDTIIDILVFKAGVAKGQKGKVLRQLWTMPQYTRVNFQYWRDQYAKLIQARRQWNGDAPVPAMKHAL